MAFQALHKMLPHRHFLIHKPYGYLSQFVCELSWKKLLGELYDFPDGTMAIGRLDEESEGLLMLTTDGRMSETVRSKKTEKEYYAQVDGIITDEAIARLQGGVEIGIRNVKYLTLPCQAKKLAENPDFPPRIKKIRDDRHGPTSWVSIILTEGKERQIRKMTAAVGFPTLRLLRIRIGPILLDTLKAGEVREIYFNEKDLPTSTSASDAGTNYHLGISSTVTELPPHLLAGPSQ